MTKTRKNPPFGITTHNECHPRYQSFITASSNDLGCFTSDTGDLCAGTDLRQLAHPRPSVCRSRSDRKNILEWRVDAFSPDRHHSQLVANSKTERGFHGSAGMKVADRRSMCTRMEADIHTTGAPATGFIVRRSATCMHVGGGI